MLDPFGGVEGGPVQNLSEKESAMYMSELDKDVTQSDIKTEDIEAFFPEDHKQIMLCDSYNRVAFKQMIKIKIKKELNNYDGSQDEEDKLDSPEKSIENEGGRIMDSIEPEMIKVHDQNSAERKELSITTPRNELLKSNEKQFRAIGDKTVLQHTFEDGGDSHSSINSNYFRKDSDSKIVHSNETSSENYTGSNYYNSNEKNSIF